MPSLDTLACFLDGHFEVEHYPDDTNGVYHPAERNIKRLGLALEPSPKLYTWAEANGLDALFLHRPWQLDPNLLAGAGVLAYHLPFDATLTLGYNPRLVAALSLRDVEAFGHKDGQRIGMMGTVSEISFAAASNHVAEVFGGLERTHPGSEPTTRLITSIAVVGAMNAGLLLEARNRGAGLYVTGQWRPHAEKAVAQTGLGVVTVGHRRSEVWGLGALAHLLRERFAGLETFVIT